MFAMLIPALIGAAAAAGQGIAGAASQQQQMSDQANMAAAQRALQQHITKMQIAAQQRQQQLDLAQGAQQMYAGTYGERAQNAQALGQRQIAANGDAMNTITGAYMR